MKLTDLIVALADEIERVQADLSRALDRLAVLESDTPAFCDALDQYGSQAQRMGEAAEMAGFPGLQAVCAHVSENTLLLATLSVSERDPVLRFLRDWPPLIVHYLRNLSDPSCAAGLVDHLVRAPYPLNEEQALKIAHLLGAMDGQVHTIFAGQEAARPVLARPEDVALDMPADVDHKLLDGFFAEAPDQTRHLIDLARNIVSGQGHGSDVIAAKRIVHTLKGTGAIIGLRGLASLGHHLEDILDHFELSGSQVAKIVADALLDSAYCLEQMVGYLLGSDEYPGQAQAVLQRVLDLANRIDRGESLDDPVERISPSLASISPVPTSALTTADEHHRSSATATPTAALRISVERVDNLFRVAGEMSVQGAAMEARLKDLQEATQALLAQNLRMQKRLFELETVIDVRAPTMARARWDEAQGNEVAGFDPLELDQYSELHSTAHALFEEAADARTMAARLQEETAIAAGTHARQQRLFKDLQHLVTGTRMNEVGILASRLQRNVRSTCQATGKQAELLIEGGDTLIDTDVINRLADPLLHMLRNAVDHGLETPPARRAAGKPETGRIVLSFSHQGQQVVLRCVDDGAGLDYAAIRRRAVERGLLAPEEAVGAEELSRMILTSGFSTRQTVSELSGRGVGLDVVREWAVSMNGSIKLSSSPGQGCAIELRFVASLSTMQSLIVDAAGERFALPSVHVVNAVPRGVGRFERMGDKLVYHHAEKGVGKVYPALDLAQAAGELRSDDKPLESFDAVIVRVADKLHALAVDRLIDSRELVVKSPSRYVRHLKGIAGLSILGDGGIAVHLDIAHLLEGGAGRAAVGVPRMSSPQPPESLPPAVLIVDDALSVRNSLVQMVQDAGYRARTARDGIEAIDLLKDFRPDIVLTDLEMPNLNGVELTSHIRGREDLTGLPVIMITSRSQEKHRRMAEQAGVDAYITKPYNDGELLRLIRTSLAA